MRPSRPLISFDVILLGVCLVLPAKAQDIATAPVRVHETMALQRLDGPITLDGLIDEAAWQKIAPYPLTMSTPTFGSALTERTEIRIAYDDAFLYFLRRSSEVRHANLDQVQFEIRCRLLSNCDCRNDAEGNDHYH